MYYTYHQHITNEEAEAYIPCHSMIYSQCSKIKLTTTKSASSNEYERVQSSKDQIRRNSIHITSVIKHCSGKRSVATQINMILVNDNCNEGKNS
jgi:hypothetical protein